MGNSEFNFITFKDMQTYSDEKRKLLAADILP